MSKREQGKVWSLIGHHFEIKQHRWDSFKSIVPFVRNKLETTALQSDLGAGFTGPLETLKEILSQIARHMLTSS
jgi:hypothetical protein